MMLHTRFSKRCKSKSLSGRIVSMIRNTGAHGRHQTCTRHTCNVPRTYCSRKIRWKNNQTLGLSVIHLMEHDSEVLEHYYQPSSEIKLEFLSKTGENIVVLYSTDLFVTHTRSAR